MATQVRQPLHETRKSLRRRQHGARELTAPTTSLVARFAVARADACERDEKRFERSLRHDRDPSRLNPIEMAPLSFGDSSRKKGLECIVGCSSHGP
jgi:hypothetical protein